MLNRRYLRIKVYQSLYAYWQSDGTSASRIEKELFLSIERTFDLYVGLLMLFGEMRRLADAGDAMFLSLIQLRANTVMSAVGDFVLANG